MNLNIILAILLYSSAACYVLLGARVILAKQDVASVSVGVTFGIIGLWVLGGALELSASSLLLFSIGRVGHFVGTALVPVSLLVCFREYTGSETSKGLIAALLLPLPIAGMSLCGTCRQPTMQASFWPVRGNGAPGFCFSMHRSATLFLQ